MTCDTTGVLQMSKIAPYSVRLIREYYPFDNGQPTTITCTVTVTDQGGSGVSKLTATTTITVTFCKYQFQEECCTYATCMSGADPGFLDGGGGFKSIERGFIFNILPDFS